MIKDGRSIEKAYSSYALGMHNQGIQRCADQHMGRQGLIFSGIASNRLGRLAKDQRSQAVKMLVAGFGFQAAASQACRYIRLFPHNTMGRYPVRLPGGKTTPGIYESRAGVALHRVYNETRLNFGLLRGYSSKLDELCGLAREHECW